MCWQDRDGNGVDRLEFVVGMLTALDLVQPADVQTISFNYVW